MDAGDATFRVFMSDLSRKTITPARCVAFVTVLWVVVFAVRLAGPPTLTDDDQERPAAYILDVIRNGNWIVQVDDTGDVTSKPPMYTWVAAIGAIGWDRLNLFTLYLPCALSVLGVAWMILATGSRMFRPRVGLIAAAVYIISMPSFLMITLARTDPLFVFFVAASTLLLWRLWETGRGALPFWVMVALATLTKGPLGLLLAVGGLLAIAWERYKPGPGSRPAGVLSQPVAHIVGIVIFLVLNLGWFLLAQMQLGDAVSEKMIGRELAGLATGSTGGGFPGSKIYQPTPWLILRFLPWSIPAAIGLWLVLRNPAADATVRRFERFLSAYLLFGLFVFSMAPHQRQVHLLPLMFPLALLAGRVIDDFITRRQWHITNARTALTVTALTVIIVISYNFSRSIDPDREATRDLFRKSEIAQQTFGSSLNVPTLDATFTYQFPGNTHVPRINTWRASELLTGEHPAFVAVMNWKRLEDSLPEPMPTLYRFSQTPDAEFGTDPVEIVSNHPRMEQTPSLATYIGDIRIFMEGAVITRSGPLNRIEFHATKAEGRITLRNENRDDPEAIAYVTIRNAHNPEVRAVELPFWHSPEVTFTAPVDAIAMPAPERPSLLRRALFVLILGCAITAGGLATIRSMRRER